MEKTEEKVKGALDSKTLSVILKIIGVAILVIIIFSAGVRVGFYKASFGRAWGDHYVENFGMGHYGGLFGGFGPTGMMDDFPNANGAMGKIMKLELPNIIVEDQGKIEKVVAISENTNIQKGGNTITSAELSLDDFIVVIGTPNEQGVIEAKLIRVLPMPDLLNRIETFIKNV